MILTPVDCQRFISDSQSMPYHTVHMKYSIFTDLWSKQTDWTAQCWSIWHSMTENHQMDCYKLNLIDIILSTMNISLVFPALKLSVYCFALLTDKYGNISWMSHFNIILKFHISLCEGISSLLVLESTRISLYNELYEFPTIRGYVSS